MEGGGLVEGLPVHNFYTDEGDIAMKCPTEVPITDRREKELADLGFIPLVHCKGTDYAAFFSVQSAQKPKIYDKDAANANARLSTQLPYILACSRFAHYLKAMMRDKIGSFMSRERLRSVAESVDHQLRCRRTITRRPRPRPASRCAKRASMWLKSPASLASTALLLSCGRTSSWTSFLCRLRLVAELPPSARG